MSDLTAQFEIAAGEAKRLSIRPDDQTLLELYAFYKQATQGDVSGSRPTFLDPVGRAKYDAWKKVKGWSQADAMQAYIDLVEGLKD